jgi:hypothetical protein
MRIWAQQSGLAERACKKIVGQRQLADLRMRDLHVDRRSGIGPGVITEDRRRALQELASPLRDLVRMYGELLGKLGL